ncbi:hypothetical protein [Archangium sp.]|uniref:hypothetical protein n=1 Tax=Archangium sp. TaxID=1872627 RepID=UPI00286CBE0D|nr:hypothetical protein [Archangium sp.]
MRISASGVAALACLLLGTTGCETTDAREPELPSTSVRDSGTPPPAAGTLAPDAGTADPDAGVPRVVRPSIAPCTDHFDETGRFCKQHSQFQQRERVVIRDAEAWASLWQQLWSLGSYKPALPAVDFTRELVVVAMMGARPSPGYFILIPEVVVRDGGLDVTVQEIEPAHSGVCGGGAVATHAVAAMRVPRIEGEVRFIETHLAYNECNL